MASFDKQRKNHKRSADNKPEPFVLLSYASRRRLSHSSAVSVVVSPSQSFLECARCLDVDTAFSRHGVDRCHTTKRSVHAHENGGTKRRDLDSDADRFGFRCSLWRHTAKTGATLQATVEVEVEPTNLLRSHDGSLSSIIAATWSQTERKKEQVRNLNSCLIWS